MEQCACFFFQVEHRHAIPCQLVPRRDSSYHPARISLRHGACRSWLHPPSIPRLHTASHLNYPGSTVACFAAPHPYLSLPTSVLQQPYRSPSPVPPSVYAKLERLGSLCICRKEGGTGTLRVRGGQWEEERVGGRWSQGGGEGCRPLRGCAVIFTYENVMSCG